jgi:hypothetical protein
VPDHIGRPSIRRKSVAGGDDMSVPGRRHPVGSISPFFCFELFQLTGDPCGAEVAGMTIPEHGHMRIPVQTTQMGAIQIDGIESLP